MPNMPADPTTEPITPVSAPAPAVDRVTARTRIVAVAAACALVALGVGWELAWARTGHGTLVLKMLPLVAALPGLLRHRMYTYRWLSLAIWLYVAEGALRIADPAPVRWLAAAELGLAVVLFAACAAQVRWRLALARRLALPEADDPRADAGTAH